MRSTCRRSSAWESARLKTGGPSVQITPAAPISLNKLGVFRGYFGPNNPYFITDFFGSIKIFSLARCFYFLTLFDGLSSLIINTFVNTGNNI